MLTAHTGATLNDSLHHIENDKKLLNFYRKYVQTNAS